MSHLHLFLFGPPRLERDNISLAVDTRKAIALLAYLAVTGESHSRDKLATLLWPDYDQSRARAVLRRTLSALLKTIGTEWLEVDREALGLNESAGLWLDVAQFRQLLAECQTHGHAPEVVCAICRPLLAQAVNLYRADFMAGFSLKDSPDFDEWQFFEAESLRHELSGALQRLVDSHSEQGEFELATAYARRWLALDPLHELAQRQLMQLYAWAGHRSAALRQYQEYVQLLDQELGVSPQVETTTLYQAIEANQVISPPKQRTGQVKQQNGEAARQLPSAAQAAAETQPAVLGLPAKPKTPSTNLPAPATPFVGREGELAALDQLLADPNCRLLTLIGPGGIGKTRLMLQVGAAHLETFSEGVFFVSFAAVDSPELLAPTIASTLGLAFTTSTDLHSQLLHYLAEKEMLLLLDNLEHLLDGVDLLTKILHQAPKVKLLVTSRERLNLRGEWVFELQGLEVPSLEAHQNIEQYSAIALFLQQARQVQTGFTLTPTELQQVAHICRLVSGMPLGIELAAAWVRLLSCAEIAQEIERNLDFLETTARDAPERHRSMRAAFDHSWNLLSNEENQVLRRLSVFRGGFQREAAQQVAGAKLAVLSALVDKSLLRRTQAGRYELHELVRQYVYEELREAGELEQSRDRHLAYFLTLAEKAEGRLQGAEQATWLNLLEQEFDNLRAALGWSFVKHPTGSGERVEQGLRLASALYRFWHGHGHLSEGYMWLEHGLSQPGSISLSVRATALNVAGWLITLYGDHNQAALLQQESLALFRQLGDKQGTALALDSLGDVAWGQGNFEQAKACYEEGLALQRQLGNHYAVALALYSLGRLHVDHGNYEQAEGFLTESLGLLRTLRDRRGMALALCSLARMSLSQSVYQPALAQIREGLSLFYELGNKMDIAECLEILACLTIRQGQADRAIRLWRAAEALREAIGIPILTFINSAYYQETIPAARAQLSEAAFTTAWAEGYNMTLEQAVAYALADEET